MTTVKEFKDLGVVIVDGDKCTFACQEFESISRPYSDVFADSPVTHFAWRPLNTIPDNPKFKFEYNSGSIRAQWRPLLDQSGAKVGEPTKPVFTQAMASMQHELDLHKANSKLLATLTDFMVKNNIGKVGESCIDVAIRELSEKHDIDIRTPKQKAIDEMLSIYNCGKYPEDMAEALYNAGYSKDNKEKI